MNRLKSAWFDGEEQKAGAVVSVFFHFNQVFLMSNIKKSLVTQYIVFSIDF